MQLLLQKSIYAVPFTYEESDAALREHDGSTRFYSIRDSSFFLTSSAVPPFKTPCVMSFGPPPRPPNASQSARVTGRISSVAEESAKLHPPSRGRSTSAALAPSGSGQNIAGSDTHSLVHFPLSQQRENAHAQCVVLRTQAVALAEHALNRARKL